MSTIKMTITIDPDLRRKLKIHAARCDRSVSDLVRGWIRDGLKAANLPPLATERPKATPPPIPLRTKR